MGRTKKVTTRSDTSSKPKAKQRDERYLKYQKYIRSKKFKLVKKAVFERDGYKCMVCGRTKDEANLTCHHRVYSHLFQGGELEANDCLTLCQYCHKGIHSIRSNFKWFSMDNPRNQEDNGKEDGDNTIQEI